MEEIKKIRLSELKRIDFNKVCLFVLSDDDSVNDIHNFIEEIDKNVLYRIKKSSQHYYIVYEVPVFKTYFRFFRVFKKHRKMYIHLIFTYDKNLYIALTFSSSLFTGVNEKTGSVFLLYDSIYFELLGNYVIEAYSPSEFRHYHQKNCRKIKIFY